MLDRIDLQVELDGITYEEFADTSLGEASAVIKDRVSEVRKIQAKRFKNDGITNSQMNNKQIKEFCVLDEVSQMLLQTAFDKLNLSARASYRILKVARTIADMAGCENIQSEHVAEAIQYRSLDRKYWGK